jgi:hypothetical protein
MAASAPVFDARDRRDDLALLDVVEKLPRVLRCGVSNPVDQSESLTERLGPEGLEEAAVKFEILEQQLRRAINAHDATQACTLLVEQFGDRFPFAPARVVPTTPRQTVRATPASQTSSPLVGRTRAG